jgi:hypothetical protein
VRSDDVIFCADGYRAPVQRLHGKLGAAQCIAEADALCHQQVVAITLEACVRLLIYDKDHVCCYMAWPLVTCRVEFIWRVV